MHSIADQKKRVSSRWVPINLLTLPINYYIITFLNFFKMYVLYPKKKCSGLTTNKFFALAVGGSLLLQLAAVYVPLLQQLFDTESLDMSDLATCALVASTVFALDEARKYWMAKTRYVQTHFDIMGTTTPDKLNML